jgi:hypothetical protein
MGSKGEREEARDKAWQNNPGLRGNGYGAGIFALTAVDGALSSLLEFTAVVS